MKLNESKVINVENDNPEIEIVKKIVYKGLEIYAVKRRIVPQDPSELESLVKCGIPTSWWCGYVEAAPKMSDSFTRIGCFEENTVTLIFGKETKKYELAYVHGGYTYVDNGIPLVCNDDIRLFLGWDYNHWLDCEEHFTYQDILKEGMKVVDSMLRCHPKSLS